MIDKWNNDALVDSNIKLIFNYLEEVELKIKRLQDVADYLERRVLNVPHKRIVE